MLGAFNSAPAAVLLGQYHLGESDPGAAAGLAGQSTTTDSSGNGSHLTKTGTATYSNSTAPGSTLAMTFSGGYYSLGNVLTTAVDNFALQAWVFPTSLGFNARMVAYNGNTSFSGFGIYQQGDAWGALFGGNHWQLFSGTVLLNQWSELTLVRDAGVNTLYINGLGFNVASLPNAAAGDFFIGGNPAVAGETFDGAIDQVRLLTFAPGTLTAADLAPVPEPATLGLAAAALAATALLRRRA